MKKVLISLLSIAVVVGVGMYATNAFFSDTETSVGNTFAAGDIDLQIDNESYAVDNNIPGFQNPTGAFVLNSLTTWVLKDLTIEKFFDFVDLKPGDYGEDTISVHVGSNDAWVCAAARLTDDSDQSCTEPELADDPTCTDPGLGQGELDNSVNFAFWIDDGDNVLETGEQDSIFLNGPLSGLGEAGKIALADSENEVLFEGPVPGESTQYIGKYWCFGNLTPAPVALGDGNPISRGTGFNCDGAPVNNAAQTDKVMADIQFYAVQARNNPEFTCDEDFTPVWPEGGDQRTKVGAILTTYVAPTGDACNVTVDDTGGNPALDTITEGVAAATAGQTVCVLAGTYPEDVNINKDITLAGAGAANTFVIGQTSGEAGAMVITADGVTVQGFDIVDTTGGISALRISGAHSNILVNSNRLSSVSGQNAFLTDGGQSNVMLSNNEFVGNTASQLVYVNGTASVAVASSNVDFFENSFSGTIVAGGIALGNESTGSDITENKFASTLTSTYAILENWEDDANVNFNNFNGVGGIKVRDSDAGAGPLDAENNWWGAAIPVGHTAGDVDETPKEASAFPEN